MDEYIKAACPPHIEAIIRPAQTFVDEYWNADFAICVAVMDVVLPADRISITAAAFQNLRDGGYFSVIVPRNDSSIIKRCNDGNRFMDGHVFKNRGHQQRTFYTNYRNQQELIQMGERAGFELIRDQSIYRQVSLIFQKPHG
jgi:hypothetical protein